MNHVLKAVDTEKADPFGPAFLIIWFQVISVLSERTGELVVGVLCEACILAGEYCIEHQSYDGCYCKAGKADGSDHDGSLCAVADTDRKSKDKSCYDNISALLEVDAVFDYVTYAYG